MNLKKAIELINEIERQFPVDTWRCCGIRMWPIIRNQLGHTLDYLGDEGTRRIEVEESRLGLMRIRRPIKHLWSWAAALVCDPGGSSSLCKKSDVVFFTYSVDRIRLENKFYNKLSDPIVRLLERESKSTLTLELLSGKRCQIPRYRPSNIIQTKIDLIGFKTSFMKRFTSIPFELDKYDLFLETLASHRIDINAFERATILHQGLLLRNIANFFRDVFEKAKPIVGFITDYSSLEGFAFVLACHEMGILSVDIQHGLAGDLHRSYGRFVKVPSSGYETLPSIFWCWSQTDANAIGRWNKDVEKNHIPVVGGNPGLCSAEYYEKAPLMIEPTTPKKTPRILFTLQHYDPPPWIREFILSTKGKYCWYVRIHPTQFDQLERVSKLFETTGAISNVQIIGPEIPLSVNLEQTDIHITGSSATVLDAATFQKPSIVIEKQAESLFEDLILSGMVKLANTPEELTQTISDFWSQKPLSTSTTNTKQLSEAVQTILSMAYQKNR